MKTNTRLIRLARVRHLAQTGEARRIRAAAGLSQGEIADFVDVRPSTVSRWETGQRTPTGPAALLWLSLLEDLDEAITGRSAA